MPPSRIGIKSRLIMGLMSGTSHDGVDAAVVRFRGRRAELVHHCRYPYPASLRKKIKSAFGGSAKEACALNFLLGEVFGRAALRCAFEAGVRLRDIEAVASHGQTICHIPPSGAHGGSTLQVGEPAVIALRTGLPVVSDFRAADMAAGGQGAPLVPYADWLFFKGSLVRAVQNIGGIANVTVVMPKKEDVVAFDTGPGNCLIDEAMGLLYGRPFDRGGRVAESGTPDMRLLNRLLKHPYFSKKPPKSTGRETFGEALARGAAGGRKKADVVSTLTHLTARSIRNAYEEFIFPHFGLDEIILAGGGTKNKYLVGLLKGLFRPIKVALIDEYGIPSAAKEAMSFAVLARETLSGRPSNLPGATGASRPVVLGKITPPPSRR